jgi:hypothetical protein
VKKDVPVLAALQLQAEYGDVQPAVHTQAWIRDKIQVGLIVHIRCHRLRRRVAFLVSLFSSHARLDPRQDPGGFA